MLMAPRLRQQCAIPCLFLAQRSVFILFLFILGTGLFRLRFLTYLIISPTVIHAVKLFLYTTRGALK